VSLSLILAVILEEKSIRPKSLRFLVIGTLEDLLVSVQVTEILYKMCMQFLEAEPMNQMH
jgi:hypothetical protein